MQICVYIWSENGTIVKCDLLSWRIIYDFMLNVEFSITENQGSIRGKLQSGGRNVCFTYLNYGNYEIGHDKQDICYFISKSGISFSERMTQKAQISMDFQLIETRTRFQPSWDSK